MTKPLNIAVDLTPVLPGGENGGAKLVALELIRHMGLIDHDYRFTLLTSYKSHDELACLDSQNIRRICVLHQDSSLQANFLSRALSRLQGPISLFLPSFISRRLIPPVAPHTRSHGSLLKEIGADLLLCPFTAPFYYDPTIPCVSVVHDLQFIYYPQFFTEEDLSHRNRCFQDACSKSSKLISVSEYVRKTILENSTLDPDQVVAIHNNMPQRLQKSRSGIAAKLLADLGLAENEYLLYPANFWAHKNHPMLFTAFGLYRSRNPESKLRLACTGSPGKAMDILREAILRMGLEKEIILPGYLEDEAFAALLDSSKALIYPSLFEGFGMPVLEAMAHGKPVLCGNLTSLPEVAGDAALYFDPKKPEEIAEAIEQIMRDQRLVEHLADMSKQRVAAFGGPEYMAREYLKVMESALAEPMVFTTEVQGIYPDSLPWTERRVLVTYGPGPIPRHLEIDLFLPGYLPHEKATATFFGKGLSEQTCTIERDQWKSLRFSLGKDGGHLEVLIDPIFQPKALGLNDDERWLGVCCKSLRIVSESKTETLI